MRITRDCLVLPTAFAALTLSAAVVLGSLDGNFFGGLDPSLPTPIAPDVWSGASLNWSTHSGEASSLFIEYNASNDSLGHHDVLTESFDYLHDDDGQGTVACDTGLSCSERHRKNAAVASTLDTAQSECTRLGNASYAYSRSHLWLQEIDTSKFFLEHCSHATQSYLAFQRVTEGTMQLGAGSSMSPLRTSVLRWLESVLYLNTAEPEYFCSCVEAIGGFLPLYPDSVPGNELRQTNVGLAVTQWLLLNTNCDHVQLSLQYNGSRRSQLQAWLGYDPNWRLAHPLDTTLPSMADLGLDTLLAKHFKYAHVEGKPFPSIVPEYALTRNPFENMTALRFRLSEASYERVDVLDVLGREVWSDGDGHLLDPGEHTVPIDMSNATAGTYYLRITLGTGEVRTIKMVKG